MLVLITSLGCGGYRSKSCPTFWKRESQVWLSVVETSCLLPAIVLVHFLPFSPLLFPHPPLVRAQSMQDGKEGGKHAGRCKTSGGPCRAVVMPGDSVLLSSAVAFPVPSSFCLSFCPAVCPLAPSRLLALTAHLQRLRRGSSTSCAGASKSLLPRPFSFSPHVYHLTHRTNNRSHGRWC